MKKYLLLLFFILSSINSFANEKINIIGTTTHLSAIVKTLIPENSNVSTLIPYGMCPGHFDISPNEVKQLNQADMILYQGFEHFIEDLFSSTHSPFIKLKVAGNLMIPENHIQAAKNVAQVLAEKYPHLKNLITPNLEAYCQQIKNQEKEVKNRLKTFKNTPVLCAVMNKDFIEWSGLKVVATIPRDEDISLRSMQRIIGQAKDANTRLIIGNLQSSGKVGQTIADELRMPFVQVSNFPKDDDYLATLQNNCTQILNALQENRNE